MNKRNIIIAVAGVLTIVVGVLFVFVYKVQGSNKSNAISECVPYNVKISKGEKDYESIIEWNTTEKCVGYIVYGDDRSNLNLVGIDTEDLSSRSHRVQLSGLLSTKLYYFVINSDSISYGNSGIPLSFSLSSL
jgi:hypothetical protein